MARKSSIPFDDIAKAIAKAIGSGAVSTGPKIVKKATKAAKSGAKAKPKAKLKAPKSKGQKRFVDARETPTIKGTFTSRGNVADIKQAYNVKTREPVIKGEWKAPREAPKKDPKKVKSVRSGTDAPTTKGPKGKPEPPRMTREQYLESQANRTLRRADGRPQARVDDPRTGVAPNIPRVPKRSKSKPKGTSASHEADPLKREVAADARRMGERTPAVTSRKKPSGNGGNKQARKAQKAELDELKAKRRAKLMAKRNSGKFSGVRPQPKKS